MKRNTTAMTMAEPSKQCGGISRVALSGYGWGAPPYLCESALLSARMGKLLPARFCKSFSVIGNKGCKD